MRTRPVMRRRLLLVLAAAPLAACGFKLRGTQTLPVETIYLALPVNSAIGAEMSRLLRSSTNARIVSDRKEAQAVFELLGESREREVVAINAQGRATEYQLRLRIRFRVLDRDARELIAPTDLVARRDITFNESDLLAKESEEGLLYRDMQSDLVRQMVNRLSAMRLEPA
jgi:LPS-assembly lipoprotein